MFVNSGTKEFLQITKNKPRMMKGKYISFHLREIHCQEVWGMLVGKVYHVTVSIGKSLKIRKSNLISLVIFQYRNRRSCALHRLECQTQYTVLSKPLPGRVNGEIISQQLTCVVALNSYFLDISQILPVSDQINFICSYHGLSQS